MFCMECFLGQHIDPYDNVCTKQTCKDKPKNSLVVIFPYTNFHRFYNLCYQKVSWMPVLYLSKNGCTLKLTLGNIKMKNVIRIVWIKAIIWHQITILSEADSSYKMRLQLITVPVPNTTTPNLTVRFAWLWKLILSHLTFTVKKSWLRMHTLGFSPILSDFHLFVRKLPTIM